MAEVMLFSPAMAEAAWPHLEPLVKRALEEGDGEYAPEDVLDFLKRGVWTAIALRQDGVLTSMAVLEALQYPRRRVLFVHLGAGADGIASVRAMYPIVREYALATGCTLIRLFGRRGWSRLLTRTGTGAGRRVREALSLEIG